MRKLLKAIGTFMLPDPPKDRASKPDRLAATQLPPIAPPKPTAPGGETYPDWRTNTAPNPARIAKKSFDVANVDITSTYRTGADNVTIIRNLTRAVPEMAASRAAHIRLGIPEGRIAIARNPDNSFNVDATRLALQLLGRMNYISDYENGFSHVASMRSVDEALGIQLWQNGAAGLELVLDKQRMPFALQPVAEEHVYFYEDDKAIKPVQRIGGDEIDLDVPTYFRVAVDPDLLDAYPQSPMESAIQPTLASATFLSDLRRLCARHIYKRFDISIDEEKLTKRVPPQIAVDPTKHKAWMDQQLQELTSLIETLGVEDALVHYDFFKVTYIEGDQTDTPELLNTIPDIYTSKIAVATKTPASVLGTGASSASAANAEVQMFLASVNGMIRVKLMELHSKWLTLACRLMGLDVTVEFIYDEIELRPKSELWAYRQMEDAFWRQKLSDGYITDEEYCLRTTGALPTPGFKPRSGTYFMDGAAPADPNADPNATSTTSNIGSNRNKPAQAPKGTKQ